MREYNLEIDRRAIKKIKEMNVKELYISVRYVKGPCNDNLCKMIPLVEVSPLKPDGNILKIYDGNIKIFAIERVYNVITRYGAVITITYQPIKKKFQVKGIPYNF